MKEKEDTESKDYEENINSLSGKILCRIETEREPERKRKGKTDGSARRLGIIEILSRCGAIEIYKRLQSGLLFNTLRPSRKNRFRSSQTG